MKLKTINNIIITAYFCFIPILSHAANPFLFASGQYTPEGKKVTTNEEFEAIKRDPNKTQMFTDKNGRTTTKARQEYEESEEYKQELEKTYKYLDDNYDLSKDFKWEKKNTSEHKRNTNYPKKGYHYIGTTIILIISLLLFIKFVILSDDELKNKDDYDNECLAEKDNNREVPVKDINNSYRLGANPPENKPTKLILIIVVCISVFNLIIATLISLIIDLISFVLHIINDIFYKKQ